MDDPLDQVIWYIGRAYYAYIGLLEKVLAETGLDRHLRPGMGPVLFALFEQDERSIKEIAARVQLAYPTLTGLLDRMEAQGLVERRRDASDGRVVRVRLTSLGRSLEPRCRHVLGIFADVLREGMGAADVLQTKQLLQCLVETMRAEEQRHP